MKNKKRQKLLKILELGKNPTGEEITDAYNHLKELYTSASSVIVLPLEDEFNSEEKNMILESIEHAYKELIGEKGIKQKIKKSADDNVDLDVGNEEIRIEIDDDETEEDTEGELKIELKYDDEEEAEDELQIELEDEKKEEAEDDLKVELDDEKEEEEVEGELKIELQTDEEEENGNELEIKLKENNEEEAGEEIQIEFEEEEMVVEREIDGPFLKKRRMEKGVKIKEIPDILNIPYKNIVNIENEKYKKLPEDGYLRWLIKTYAKFLNINENKAAEDYMRKYRIWKKENS